MLKAAPAVAACALVVAVFAVAVPGAAQAESNSRRGYVPGYFSIPLSKSAPQQGKRAVAPAGSVKFVVDPTPLSTVSQGSSNAVQKIRNVPSRGTQRATLRGNKTLTVGGSRTENQ